MGCKCDFFGVFCFLFLYLLIGYTDYVCVFQILAVDQEKLLSFYILAAGYQVVLFMLIWSHLMCLCSDPGTVDLTLELTRKPKQKPINGVDGSPASCSSPCEIEYILPSSINNNHNNRIYQKSFGGDTSSGGSGSSGGSINCGVVNNGAGSISSSNNSSTTITATVRSSMTQQQQQPLPIIPILPPPRSYLHEFEWTFCRFCNIYRPPRAHHCHICRRCILLRDHHCPWINNCVGERNQKYFLQFTSYACIGSLYTIACIVISCLYSTVASPPMKISIHVALLVLASVIFGIFSVAVLCDQVTGIFNDQTNHERLVRGGRKGPKRGRMRALRATCGYISIFLWLLPLPFSGHQEKDLQSSIAKGEKEVDAAELWSRDQLYAL